MPWMKLDSKSHSTSDKHHGNAKAVMGEAHEERWGSDPDIDRDLTSQNLYMGYRSGMELLNDINHEIEALSEQLRSEGKRGVRKDAITSFAGIVKPEKELMDSLTKEQQIKFFADAIDILNEKFGSHNGKNNIRSFVIHFDEGNPHMHYFGVPYTDDGRLSAKEIFTPKLSRWLNEDFPKLMNSKGWDLEPCRDENSYQPEVAAALNEQELAEYKKQCYEYKKTKAKKHGKASKAYKEEQAIKDGFETGFDAVLDQINDLANEIANERLKGPLNTLKQLIEREMTVANELEAYAYQSQNPEEEAELRDCLKNITFKSGKTGLDLYETRKANRTAERVKTSQETKQHLEELQSQITKLETLSEQSGLTDKEQALLDKLYRNKTMSEAEKILSQKQPEKELSDYAKRFLRQAELRQNRTSRDFGLDLD